MLRLVQYRANSCAAGELTADPHVRHSAKTGKSLQFEELGIIEAQRLCHLPKRVRLGLAADPADAGADVDCRLLPFMKEFGIEYNLTVGDRN